MFPLVSKASDGSEPKRVSLVALQRRWQGQVHSAPTTAAVAGEIAPHGKPEDFVGTCRQGAGLRGIQSDVSLTLRTTFIGCVHILVNCHGAGLCPALGRAIGGKILIFRPPGRVFGVVARLLVRSLSMTGVLLDRFFLSLSDDGYAMRSPCSAILLKLLSMELASANLRCFSSVISTRC